MKTLIIGLAMLALIALAPSMAAAHEGHAHKVMGTVTSVQGSNLMVKSTDGKSVTVMIDAKTKITQGKTKVELAALKVGDRIVAEGADKKGTIVATSVRVGETPVAAAKN